MVFSGVPHATMTSDVYNGYFIPKGLYYVQLPKFADDPMINLPGVVVLLNIMYGDGRPHAFALNFSK